MRLFREKDESLLRCQSTDDEMEGEREGERGRERREGKGKRLEFPSSPGCVASHRTD
jgi:hypothetical protein